MGPLQATPMVPTIQSKSIVYAPSIEYTRFVPYRFSRTRMALFVTLVLATGGLVGIVSVWFPRLFTWVARMRLPYSSLGSAQYMLILVSGSGLFSQWVEVPVHQPKAGKKKQTTMDTDTHKNRKPTASPSNDHWVWFEFRKQRYVFDEDTGEFRRYLAMLSEDLVTIRDRLTCGLPTSAVTEKQSCFGDNRRTLPVARRRTALLRLFFTVTRPYYVFQLLCVVFWLSVGYTIYALIVLGLSLLSVGWEIGLEAYSRHGLRQVLRTPQQVRVHRDGASLDLIETALVPGDIVVLRAGHVVADMLLLTGRGCVIDSSALNGDATPVLKVPAPSSGLVTATDARVHLATSFLEAGSTITRVCSTEGTTNNTNNSNHPASSEHVRTECLAVVLSTGFSTSDGEVFRGLLYPHGLVSRLTTRDWHWYVIVLAVFTLTAMVCRVFDWEQQRWAEGLVDLVTIGVPPVLPVVLTLGICVALTRLRRNGIACLSSQRLGLCSQITTVCFDKTGTLTTDSFEFLGLDVASVDSEDENKENQPVTTRAPGRVQVDLPEAARLVMATCHSLTTVDGQLRGDVIELALVQASQLSIHVPSEEEKEKKQEQGQEPLTQYLAVVHIPSGMCVAGESRSFGVVRQFPFDPVGQRASVVVEELATKQRFLLVKGAPEVVHSLTAVTSNTNTTDADQQLGQLQNAAQGHYSLALAMRALTNEEAAAPLTLDSQDELEHDLQILGVVHFRNELRPECVGVVQDLYAAEIDVRMITGDHALTALAVARSLGIPRKSKHALVDMTESTAEGAVREERVPTYQCLDNIREAQDLEDVDRLPFNGSNMSRVLGTYDIALTGEALYQLRGELSELSMRHLLHHTRVFARMRPAQKTWIVEQLMGTGHVVAMVGDGTNDCGALQAAHAGLALANGQASMVAPFTSTQASDIVARVPVLIREARCAQATALAGFRFMFLYPILQLMMSTTVGHFEITLSDPQRLWDDAAIVLGLAVATMCAPPALVLARHRPRNRLFTKRVVQSIVGQLVLAGIVFGSACAILRAQSWYCSRTMVHMASMMVPSNGTGTLHYGDHPVFVSNGSGSEYYAYMGYYYYEGQEQALGATVASAQTGSGSGVSMTDYPTMSPGWDSGGGSYYWNYTGYSDLGSGWNPGWNETWGSGSEFSNNAKWMMFGDGYLLPESCAFYRPYLALAEDINDEPFSHEGTTVWLFGHLQYMVMAAVVNVTDSFRKPWFRNAVLVVYFLGLLGVNFWFLLDADSRVISDTFETAPTEVLFRVWLLLLFVGHLLVSLLLEAVITGAPGRWRCPRLRRRLGAGTSVPPQVEEQANEGEEESFVKIDITDSIIAHGDEAPQQTETAAMTTVTEDHLPVLEQEEAARQTEL